VATHFGRIAAIFRPTDTDQVLSMCVQYGIPYQRVLCICIWM